MTRFRFACRSHWHVLSGPRVRLLVEFLEARNVPSASVTANGIPLLTESEPSETADRATVLNLNNSIAVDGFIGHGSCGAADVDWYQFQLAEPSLVDLEIGPQPNNQTPAAVLTLYNSDIFTDTGDYDFFGNPGQFFENVYVGEPSLAQAQGSAALGEARILRELAPGTYYVAVSGAGNSYFNPFLADSGLAGAEGPYRLQITASDLSLPSSPQLLEAEGSPLLLRLDLSAPLDADSSPINVDLVDQHGNDFSSALADWNFNSHSLELQVAMQYALDPGCYSVIVTDENGGLLFQGNVTVQTTFGNDHDLQDITHAGLVQRAGILGDDPPFFDNPNLNPADDVQMYQFQISGPGPSTLVAEVFAGRMGSPLDAGVSVFQYDPLNNNPFTLIGGNNNSANPTLDTQGNQPLYTDPVLIVTLDPGDYYIYVSSGFNTPSPIECLTGFDPNSPYDGTSGTNTGPYVLNLQVHPLSSQPPRVVASSLENGAILGQPPTQFTIQFDEPVNLQELSNIAYLQSQEGQPLCLYIQSEEPAGHYYFPRLENYDPVSNEATFLMLDRLPQGSYQLHLSGPGGIVGLSGLPLAGNDPSGDYVISFSVWTGFDGDPCQRFSTGDNDCLAQAQDLGVLFPHELQSDRAEGGVSINLSYPSSSNPYPVNCFRFQIIQAQSYSIYFTDAWSQNNTDLRLWDSSGTTLLGDSGQTGILSFFNLNPGTYILQVNWTGPPPASSSTVYQLRLAMLGDDDNAPPPPFDFPEPVMRTSFGDSPPLPPEPAPKIVTPSVSQGDSTASPTTPLTISFPVTMITTLVNPLFDTAQFQEKGRGSTGMLSPSSFPASFPRAYSANLFGLADPPVGPDQEENGGNRAPQGDSRPLGASDLWANSKVNGTISSFSWANSVQFLGRAFSEMEKVLSDSPPLAGRPDMKDRFVWVGKVCQDAVDAFFGSIPGKPERTAATAQVGNGPASQTQGLAFSSPGGERAKNQPLVGEASTGKLSRHLWKWAPFIGVTSLGLLFLSWEHRARRPSEKSLPGSPR